MSGVIMLQNVVQNFRNLKDFTYTWSYVLFLFAWTSLLVPTENFQLQFYLWLASVIYICGSLVYILVEMLSFQTVVSCCEKCIVLYSYHLQSDKSTWPSAKSSALSRVSSFISVTFGHMWLRWILISGWSGVGISVAVGNFSPNHRVQIGSGAHAASYSMGNRGSFPGGILAGAWIWPLTSI